MMGVIIADCIKLIESNQDSAVTGMKTCDFTYEWTIKNFKRLCSETIESPSFSSHYADFDDEWILKYYPSDDQCNYISVELQLKSFNNNTSQLQTKYLMDPKNRYIQNDELKICCTITLPKKLTNNSNVISSFDAKQQLSVDLKKLLSSEKSADVTIKVGQKSFRAIKGILAVRSPVFAAIFDKASPIDQTAPYVVAEFFDTVTRLLYIYTDESPNVDKMPMELLAAADKYQVDCLKNICEEIICKSIDNDNVASLLVCSDRYNLKKLNQTCFEFMKKNLQAVLLNETFKVYRKKYPEIFVGALEELLLSASSVNYD
ncbi:speckle-type POZ protein-like B [Aphidius gifuensis]|uniref:speckle-type POZ protein-like B n=1 Tax=Aphidius gifuensis TaxID=684658 RepID=UPI001CDC0A09|nr:speckle-type POZ protein-like B [Aphidius gifuensis]